MVSLFQREQTALMNDVFASDQQFSDIKRFTKASFTQAAKFGSFAQLL
jgi:hypothetical protein